MMIAAVITGCLNDVVLAITPVERWRFLREFSSNFVAERWFILIGIIAIAILTILLFVVSFKRTRQERKASDELFAKYAEKRGLTIREYQILIGIAERAGLKRNESIFTLSSAFDRGVAKMTEESFAGQQGNEISDQLKAELSFLREKLGFKKEPSYSRGIPAKSKRLSTRQIPIGKKINITRREVGNSGDIESIVVKNSDNELVVRLAKPMRVNFKELLCVRYYFCASVWEFDTSVVSYDGDLLVLNHSDNVRFINRRRFLRVPVRISGFIASFPFERPFIESGHSGEDEMAIAYDLGRASAVRWGPPEFVPAVVTELAGPGLRIESRLEVKEGERILVAFGLDEEGGRNLTNTTNTHILKIVEDIGEVRHSTVTPDGMSIAVELTGLSDSDVDELIRITNASLVRAKAGNKNISALINEVEHMVKSVVTQGV